MISTTWLHLLSILLLAHYVQSRSSASSSSKLTSYKQMDAFNRQVCGMSKYLMKWQEAGDGFDCNKDQSRSTTHNDHHHHHHHHHQRHHRVCSCNKRRSGAKQRLSFGYEPHTNVEFPSHAQVHWPGGYCQAALIHDDLLITAAHCTTNIKNATQWAGPLTDVQVYLGSSVRSNGDGRAESIKAKWACRMKDFVLIGSRPTSLNDVGLIKLVRPVKYSDKIRPICLDFARKHAPNATCVQAGFGDTTNSGNPAHKLRALPYKLFSQHNDTRQDRSWYLSAHPTWAGSSCNGDSGSALVCYDKCSPDRTRAYAVGVVIDGPPNKCRRGHQGHVEVADFHKLGPLMEEMLARCIDNNENQ